MKIHVFFLFALAQLQATSFPDYGHEPKIAVQNSILAKVNGKTISMMDVKKKMDVVFHQNYPQLEGQSPAKLQFYDLSWRHVLRELIDHELIIADALDKEIKLTDGEIRETLEERFGPNVMQTLDRIGLSYDESWQMIKDEMIVQRMSWWFVQSKAISSVTPQDIRQAYRLYMAEHPPYSEWTYRVISLRSEKEEGLSIQLEQIQTFLSSPLTQERIEKLKQIEGVSVSKEFIAKTDDLSTTHRTALEGLAIGQFSPPLLHTSRQDSKEEGTKVYRIFYLAQKNDHPAPSFEDLSASLRNELVQKAVADESKAYVHKLRKHYGFEETLSLSEDLHPFSLQ